MKYTIYLSNGTKFEHATRGWWEQWQEAWNWRIYKVDKTYKIIPKHSILYIETELKTK